ncbi:hypothetical protein C8_87 [Cannes 8 virus]|nr:hypothetical protein C8_87 [Cannes 8 virus]
MFFQRITLFLSNILKTKEKIFEMQSDISREVVDILRELCLEEDIFLVKNEETSKKKGRNYTKFCLRTNCKKKHLIISWKEEHGLSVSFDFGFDVTRKMMIQYVREYLLCSEVATVIHARKIRSLKKRMAKLEEENENIRYAPGGAVFCEAKERFEKTVKTQRG